MAYNISDGKASISVTFENLESKDNFFEKSIVMINGLEPRRPRFKSLVDHRTSQRASGEVALVKLLKYLTCLESLVMVATGQFQTDGTKHTQGLRQHT